jgi:protein-disulfide isomerase
VKSILILNQIHGAGESKYAIFVTIYQLSYTIQENNFVFQIIYYFKIVEMLRPLFDIKRDHYSGIPEAPVELVQYGGYQCRHCGDVLPVIRQLQETMGVNLIYIFRHFPLPNLHHLALDTAAAAEAAGLQGKFWAMHNMILENQLYLNRASLSFFADEIDLDMALYNKHLNSRQLYDRIISDFESGIHSGVNGTPTFFVNGLRYNGFDDFNGLYKVCRYASNYYKMVL